MTTPRTWKYGLTADEWLQLAAIGTDSEVQPCCGDIDELRGWLNCIATNQGEGQTSLLRDPTLAAYQTALDSHDTLADRATFPLLHRVLDGIRAEQAAWDAEIAETRARYAHRDRGQP